MSIDAVFAQFFDNIHDPRQHAKIYYPFYDVLFLTVCAVIGGAEGWEDIEDFGEVHLPWFQWLITSCRSANNIMPITFFLPAFIASSFYSA